LTASSNPVSEAVSEAAPAVPGLRSSSKKGSEDGKMSPDVPGREPGRETLMLEVVAVRLAEERF